MGRVWECDKAKESECVDQLETCPEIAPKNKCMTLAMICCETCEKYLANRTAIIEEALEEARNAAANGTTSDGGPIRSGTVGGGSSGISTSVSISSASMNMRPSGTNREIQVTGGLFGNMTQTEVIIEKPKPSQETPSEQATDDEDTEAKEGAEPEPEPESESASSTIKLYIPFFVILFFN